MATISASIALQDKMTPIMKSMLSGMNSMIASFEKIEKASGRAIDTKSMAAAKAEIARAGAAFKELENDIDKATKQQEKFNDSAKGGSTATGGLIGKIGGVVAAYATLQGAQKVMGLSDQYTQTTARLDLMNDGLQSTEELQAMIYKSAQDSRGVYTDTADAVSKMGLMAKDAFSSNAEAVQFMEQINKQYVMAGTSAAGAQAATLQLTQAMASGVLRGEELNSIFEQAPTIIQSISKYLGVPIGQIRAMAAEGQITADIVKQAMFATADETNAKFNSMPKTFEQTWNSFTNMAGKAFQGVFAELSDMANSKELEQFINIAADGVMVVTKLSKQILIAVAAFAAYKTVISPTISIGKAAVLSFKTITGAIAVMTTGATAATPAIASMSAALTFLTGPVGIIIALLGAFAVAGVVMHKVLMKGRRLTDEQTAANKKFIASSQGVSDSLSESIASRSKSIKSAEDEIIVTQNLATKLFDLSEKQSKSAWEMQLLNNYVGQFNSIMPSANLLIDEQTGALNLSRDAVNELIAAEASRIQSQAINEALLQNARDQLTAKRELNEAQIRQSQLEQEYAAVTQAVIEGEGSKNEKQQKAIELWDKYQQQLGPVTESVANLTARQSELTSEQATLNGILADPNGWNNYINGANTAQAASITFADGTTRMVSDFQTTAPILAQTATDAMNNMDAAIQGGTTAVAASTEATGQQAAAGFIQGVLGNQAGIADAGKTSAQILIDSTNSTLDVNSPSKVFQKTGNYVGDGLIQGLKDRESQIAAGGDAAATALKNSFKSALGINSPSTVFRDFGFYAIDGLIEGLSSTELMTFCEGIVQEIKDAFANNKFTLQTGIDFLGSGAPEFFKEIGVGGANLGDLVAPVAGGITSGFGYRDAFMTDSGQMSSSYHEGIDIGAAYGAAVGAAGAGQVTFAGDAGGYGNMVRIDHGGGLQTMYAHLSSILVSVGEFVTKMQTIGLVGSTGNSTGAHLHFGLYQDGVAIDPSALFGGYAAGTNFATRGLHLVGEKGPEIMSFAGGEKVLDADKSKQILNSTGKNKTGNNKTFAPIIKINMGDTVVNSDMDIAKVAKQIGKKLKDEIIISSNGFYEAM